MQRILEKISGYNFTVKWASGKSHCIADAFSRSPIINPEESDALICNIFTCTDTDTALSFIILAAQDDDRYKSLYQAIQSMDYKDVKKLPAGDQLRCYLKIWNDLSLLDNGLIIYDGHRILVPSSVRSQVLEKLHLAHQGITRTKARARALYFWIGMNNDISQLIESCEKCQCFRASQQKEELHSSMTTATRPFSHLSADLFEFGNIHFMVIVDRFSGWPVVTRFDKLPNASRIVSKFRSYFRDYGIAEVI
jgi:hypothetical protein